MGRPKKTTKSTEPVQPEIQPVVVSEEKAELGETQPTPVPTPDDPGIVFDHEPTELTPEDFIPVVNPVDPPTNVVTNLPTLEEGEELYTITQADLDRNPELVSEGVSEGEQIILGPVVSPEELVLDALSEEDFVEINEVLEQFVNNPEDVQANRFIKKLLTGMVASGEIDVQNQVHLLLGSAYYKSGDPVTRYQTLRTVPVYAKKRQ
jgi:hypothetical protein